MSNKKIILVLLIICVIILFVGILTINYQSKSTSSLGNNLKNYTYIKTKFNSLKLSGSNAQNKTTYPFGILENKNSSPQDNYNATSKIAFFLSRAYSLNNSHAIYNFIANDLNTFAKDNFPKFYNKNDFSVTCIDSICADSREPLEILSIINEINSVSAIPNASRNTAIQNLKSAMYFPSNSKLAKANMYASAENNIRDDPDFIKTNLNNKIADEINAFIKQYYPKEYGMLIEFKIIKKP